MKLEKLAVLISNLFSPLTLIPLTIYFIIHHSSQTQAIKISSSIIIGLLLVSLLIVGFYLKRRKIISDWDMTLRKQRYSFLVVASILSIISLFFVKQVTGEIIFKFMLLIVLWLILFTLITFFWKISGHMGAVTIFTLSLIVLFQYYWLLLLIPLVGWSRIYRKKHDVWQVIAGTVLPFIIFVTAHLVDFI